MGVFRYASSVNHMVGNSPMFVLGNGITPALFVLFSPDLKRSCELIDLKSAAAGVGSLNRNTAAAPTGGRGGHSLGLLQAAGSCIHRAADSIAGDHKLYPPVFLATARVVV